MSIHPTRRSAGYRLAAAALTAVVLLGGSSVNAAPASHPAAAPGAPTASNAVITWQKAAQEAVQAYNISNQLSGRLYAYTNLAVYQALLDNKASKAPANETAVATIAAHDTLVSLFPFRGTTLDKLAVKGLAGLSREEVDKAKAVAGPVAAAAVATAAADGVGAFEPYSAYLAPADSDAPDGRYRAAWDSNGGYSLYPQLGSATGITAAGSKKWAKDNLAKYYAKPYDLGAKEYADAVERVRAVGAKNASARSPDQGVVAKFWADGNGTPAITGHYYDIAASLLPAGTSLLDTAELFARIGVAQLDASIAAWDVKYSVLFWRPVTAIRTGGTGPGGAGADREWVSLLATPAHPEYPSGHSVSAAASAAVIADWFGGDGQTFTTNTVAPGFSPRTYTSLKASVDEVGASRVYGGVHFQKAVDDGRDLGYAVAAETQAAFNAGSVKLRSVGGGKPASA